MKNAIYFPLVFTFVFAVWLPFLVAKGTLGFYDSDLIYPTVGSFVAVYGGLTASIVWWYQNVYKLRKK